jgi:hypothetical protein
MGALEDDHQRAGGARSHTLISSTVLSGQTVGPEARALGWSMVIASRPEAPGTPRAITRSRPRRRSNMPLAATARKLLEHAVEGPLGMSSRAGLRRHVRHVGGWELERRTMYFATVVRETCTPSFANSPWRCGAPHRPFSWLIRRISACVSAARTGRPGRVPPRHPRRERHTPCRRQRRTVSACTMCTASGHRTHTADNRTQKQRSAGEQCGRLPE